ncbi:hypothetical protein F0Q45_22850 [Mycobacterium simiae]|uniref:Secreted protein n=1 Tax=Mycobacterium simiae TaxID=1784 RepID=A0A5B1BG08_MYCSI|nr:hypothetical protein [Mycobacterium simiae]KAA1246992.1 hypothetical protein F0Q45_22850 [Mycobacterium simiae]
MNTIHILKRMIAGTLLCGGVAVAGSGLAPDAANAQAGRYGPFPAAPRGPYQWCPGDWLPPGGVNWDMNVCHTWYWVDYGFQANRGGFVYEGDTPPPDLGCIPLLCLPGL